MITYNSCMKLMVIIALLVLFVGCGDDDTQETNVFECEDITIFSPDDADDVDGNDTFEPSSVDGSGDDLGEITITICGDNVEVADNNVNVDADAAVESAKRLSPSITVESGTVRNIVIRR